MRCRYLLLLLALIGCSRPSYRQTLQRYLNASSVEETSRYMAENYRSFFKQKKGAGSSREEALASFRNWDAPLHPDVEILAHSREGSRCVVRILEQNDFSKPIGYPGWKAVMEFVFDSRGKLQESIYIPDSTNPSHKPYLQPALDWLRRNHPDRLQQIYQNNRLVQTEATAIQWRELLRQWKQQAGK